MAEHYDLIVIGAGPAGAQAAAQAAALGKSVALVEREPYLGGAGFSTGAMPSKMLREAAVTLAALRQRAVGGLAWSLKPGLRLSDLMYDRAVVVEAAWGAIQRQSERLNIRLVHGAGVFQDPHTISVAPLNAEGDRTVTLAGAIILVATGSAPVRPPLFPFDHPQVRDTDSLLSLDHLPRSIAIVGGGAIGCEYASIFNALGAAVTVIEKQPRLLMPVDAELVRRWQQHLEHLGVVFRLADDVTRVETPAAGQPGDVRLALDSGESLAAEVVLVAVGRRGHVAGLNLSAAGLEASPLGHLPVNAHYQTAVPHIYAAGDVVGWPALASTSMAQARVAVAHAFGRPLPGPAPVYPVAVYTVPELAMAGLSEEACRRQGLAYAVGRAEFEHNAHAQMTGDTGGLLKLVFDPPSLRLLGVHIMCPTASDLIHLGVQVLSRGGTLEEFTAAVYNYPTLSEAYRAAALDGLERLQARDTATGW